MHRFLSQVGGSSGWDRALRTQLVPLQIRPLLYLSAQALTTALSFLMLLFSLQIIVNFVFLSVSLFKISL